MGPKSRRPKHVREYLGSGDYYVYSVQCPESALTEMRFLMFYFMEKYEEEGKKVSKLAKELRDIREDHTRGRYLDLRKYGR